ncbi:MAG: hydroxyacid dehydrogenase [Propionibacteriaceae bacterium]
MSVRIYVAITGAEFNLLFTQEAQAALAGLAQIVHAPEGPDERAVLPQQLGAEYDIVITSWVTDPGHPDRFLGGRLQLIVHAAASIRWLVPRWVLEQGIRACQSGAEPQAVPVAESALALTLVLLRHVHRYDRQLQGSRDWTASRTPELGRDLAARRVGIVGLSRTGTQYLRMVQGLGVRGIRLYDPYVDHARARELGVELVPLDELLASCDVVSLHAPVTDETRGMIGAEQLGRLRDDAVLINTARSALVDTEALVNEVTSGRINAGLDVFDTEPLPADSPFFGLPNVVVLPHVGAATIETRHGQGAGVVAELRRHLTGQALRDEVTLDRYDRLG